MRHAAALVLVLALVGLAVPVRADEVPGHDGLNVAGSAWTSPTGAVVSDVETGLLAGPALVEFGRGERLALQLPLAEALRSDGSVPRRRMDAVLRRVLGLAVPAPGTDPAVTGSAAQAHRTLATARGTVLAQVEAYDAARARVVDLLGLDAASVLTAAALDAASPVADGDEVGGALVHLAEMADHLVRAYRRFAASAGSTARALSAS